MTPALAPDVAPQLLVADDDAEIRGLILDHLAGEGYRPLAAGDVAEIRAMLATVPIDLIVLDLTLPDGDGLTLCRDLRAEGYRGAIIMVTARDSAIDRVLGLELGADDYLTKPFEPRELSARIRILLRRAPRDTPGLVSPRVARFARWRLDLVKRRLIAPDKSLVILSATEFAILRRMVEAPAKMLPREALLPERAGTASFDRIIDTQISNLRQKLSPDGDQLILTVRGRGYLLAADVDFE